MFMMMKQAYIISKAVTTILLQADLLTQMSIDVYTRQDEEGNITRNKILAVGSMVILLSIIAGINAQAAHRCV